MNYAIPVIRGGFTGSDKNKNIDAFGRALHDVGFAAVGTVDLISCLPAVFRAMDKVFGLPHATKMLYARPDIGFQRGYTPPFTEEHIACRSSGAGGQSQPDAKENWFVGPELKQNDICGRFENVYIPNIWPKEVSEFKYVMRDFYEKLYGYGLKILPALEEFMGKPPGFFKQLIFNTPHIMRTIHYMPLAENQVGKVVWGCNHTDLNFLTILVSKSMRYRDCRRSEREFEKPGLWMRRRDGQWVHGRVPPYCFIVQAADMLEILTGGEFMSANHKIVAPLWPGEGRLSVAFFLHVRPDVVLEPPESNPYYQPIMANEFLEKRLEAVRLKR